MYVASSFDLLTRLDARLAINKEVVTPSEGDREGGRKESATLSEWKLLTVRHTAN